MADRKEIDQRYLDQANTLEAEFFDIIDEGLPAQHRVLKEGKSTDEFNQKHGNIWRNHEAELIARGFMEPPVEPEPIRDLAQEIDALKEEVEKLKAKLAMK